MERVVQTFDSFDEAERADEAWLASLTPQQRVNLLLELIERYRSSLGQSAERLERVSRVARLEEG